MILLYELLKYILMIFNWIVIIQAVLSWLVAFNVVNLHNDAVRGILTGLDKITEPIYRPIRKLLPDFGGLDFTPMVVLLIIWFLQGTVLPLVFAPLLAAG